MSAPQTPSDHSTASDAVRLRFERYGTMIPVAVIAFLLLLLLVAIFLPKGLGEMLISRCLQIKDAVVELLGVLGALLGMSWGRGHMDRRLEVQK